MIVDALDPVTARTAANRLHPWLRLSTSDQLKAIIAAVKADDPQGLWRWWTELPRPARTPEQEIEHRRASAEILGAIDRYLAIPWVREARGLDA